MNLNLRSCCLHRNCSVCNKRFRRCPWRKLSARQTLSGTHSRTPESIPYSRTWNCSNNRFWSLLICMLARNYMIRKHLLCYTTIPASGKGSSKWNSRITGSLPERTALRKTFSHSKSSCLWIFAIDPLTKLLQIKPKLFIESSNSL